MPGVKGQSGRKKKPKRQHELLGDHHKGRLNQDEPDRIAEHPALIGPDLGDVGKSIWQHFEPMLYNNGTLSASDALAFSMLCKRYDEWFDAWQRCESDGRYLIDDYSQDEDRRGNQTEYKEAPWSKVESRLWDQIVKLCREFGLTPVSRSGVAAIARGDDARKIKGVT